MVNIQFKEEETNKEKNEARFQVQIHDHMFPLTFELGPASGSLLGSAST